MSRRTSVSRLTSIARCGLAYELERVEKLPALPAGWTAQGIAVHEAADVWEKAGRPNDPRQAQDAFKSAWREEIAKGDERYPDRDRWLVGGRKKVKNDLIDRYEGGLQQVANYIDYNLQDPTWQPYTMPDGSVASEVGFEVEFAGVAVRGYIDLLMESNEGTLKVRDIKTGSKVPAVPFQLIVYRMAVNDIFGVDVGWGEFFMTRDNKPTLPIDLTKLDVEWIKKWFLRQVQIEEQRLFLPNPGDACRTCGVEPHCPLMR
ncbi:PD-(D/E)XK nuclease family protein [Nonomuraea dietziae]|uniref:RecB family exonuclease n=1 Tax=Nonomuraea dietziae TaxID=65515 RepID=UPI0033EE8A30